MNNNQSSIKQLEADLWASADILGANANLNASQYCMLSSLGDVVNYAMILIEDSVH